jgi:hypothetical protein
MSMRHQPDDSLSNEEEAESRAYRRIADALERDDIDELAAALGQVPDPTWDAPDSDGAGRRISQGGRQKSGNLWSGLRRLASMLQPRRQI